MNTFKKKTRAPSVQYRRNYFTAETRRRKEQVNAEYKKEDAGTFGAE
jgi:hypothetical protein